jgi:hypothetical protein
LIKNILYLKIFFASSFWILIGALCGCVVAKSVYYDGVLVVLSLFENTKKPNDQIIDV